MKELNQCQNHMDKQLIKLNLKHMFPLNKLMFKHLKHMSKAPHKLILIKPTLLKITNQQQHMFKVTHKKFKLKAIINLWEMLPTKQEKLEKVMDTPPPILITNIENKVIIYYKYF